MIGKDYIETTAAQVTPELLRLGFGPVERVSIITEPVKLSRQLAKDRRCALLSPGVATVTLGERSSSRTWRRGSAGALRRSAVSISIFGPEWPDFNPMRVLRNRVVDEWTDRLAEVPTVRDDLPVIGRTIFLGQETEMRKFNVLPPTADTDGDWQEMPWLAGQGVGLIRDIRPAKDVVETMQKPY